MNDGSFLLSSSNQFDSNGQTIQQMTIAKTDTNGDITGCDNYPTCLKVEDFIVETGIFTIDPIEVLDLEPDTVEVSPYTFTFSPYCDYPAPPTPTFMFSDSLCIGEVGQTSGTYNRLAQAREWLLKGPVPDSILRDSTNFSYQFSKAGEYKLTQTIWMLGCSYSFEKNITVLPPLEVAITPDHICPDSMLELWVTSNRPIRDFDWDSGLTTPTQPISAEGNYTIIVYDGFCEAMDTANVVFVSNLLGDNPPFILPQDTVSCQPFTLAPQSSFSDQFFTDADPAPAASFTLEVAGSYRIGMSAFGCEFWEDFEYGVDCHVDIYLPTSFSPNGDGINDVFQPLGSDFEVLELAVYDRWGGLRNLGVDWDGGKAGQGVYLYKLRYRNLRSGEEVEVEGEVVLVK